MKKLVSIKTAIINLNRNEKNYLIIDMLRYIRRCRMIQYSIQKQFFLNTEFNLTHFRTEVVLTVKKYNIYIYAPSYNERVF